MSIDPVEVPGDRGHLPIAERCHLSSRQVSWLAGRFSSRALPIGLPDSGRRLRDPAHSGATAADFHRFPYSPGTGTWTNEAAATVWGPPGAVKEAGMIGERAGEPRAGRQSLLRLRAAGLTHQCPATARRSALIFRGVVVSAFHGRAICHWDVLPVRPCLLRHRLRWRTVCEAPSRHPTTSSIARRRRRRCRHLARSGRVLTDSPIRLRGTCRDCNPGSLRRCSAPPSTTHTSGLEAASRLESG